MSPEVKFLLTKLAEECGETIQAACKTILHGEVGEFRGRQFNNLGNLVEELSDIEMIRRLLVDHDINLQFDEARIARKTAYVKQRFNV